MPAQHACSGPGGPTAALLLEVAGRRGATPAPADTCPACCAIGYTPSSKPVLGASTEDATFLAAHLCQQGNNGWCSAQVFCTPLCRHMVAAEGMALAVLTSRGAGRQPQPGRPGWVLPPMTGWHVLGHNSAPRRRMEARRVALESLQPGGSDPRAHGPKSTFGARAKCTFGRQHLGLTWGAGDASHSMGRRKRGKRAASQDGGGMEAGLRVACTGKRRGVGSPTWRAGWSHAPRPCCCTLLCKLICRPHWASPLLARILGSWAPPPEPAVHM